LHSLIPIPDVRQIHTEIGQADSASALHGILAPSAHMFERIAQPQRPLRKDVFKILVDNRGIANRSCATVGTPPFGLSARYQPKK
jgi:hypothetical protein